MTAVIAILTGVKAIMEETGIKLEGVRLEDLGQGKDLAAQTEGSAHASWRPANRPALAIALPNAYFGSLVIPWLTVGR